MRVLDLFSGIGGFSLGLERAGMKTVAFCEIEEFPRKVLRKHWPDVPIYTDVTKLCRRIYDCEPENEDGEVICPRCNTEFGECDCIGTDQFLDEVGGIDVICGGFPCQDISVAGHQLGIEEGQRSGLWFEFARIVGELQPRYVIVENVSNLLGRGLGRVLGDLAALGYDAEWCSLQAAAVGLPHFRDRVWILAYPTASRQEALLAEIEQSCEESARENRKRFQLCGTRSGGTRWIPNEVVCSVVDGIPKHLDGLAAAGNAVVPQIPEIIGRAILCASSAP